MKAVSENRAVEGGFDRNAVLAAVRHQVRQMLEATPGYRHADAVLRKNVARRMVEVSMEAAELVAEDARLTEHVAHRAAARRSDGRQLPLAAAQAAGDQLGLQATRAAGDTLRQMREAIDFPTFVTSLISGVFRSILRSNLEQITSLSDLLENVSASSDSFAARNIGDGDVVGWLLSRFGFLDATRDEAGVTELRVRAGEELSEHREELIEGLDATGNEVDSIDEDDLVETLVPLARRKVGRDRQQILGTLVQLGLQRVVVDQGRLHASMDMRVDARSASEQQLQNRSDFRLTTGASARMGIGPWGASGSMTMSVGHVRSDEQFTQEELATQAGLRSSVDLVFRTEQVPLDRMANEAALQRIDANAIVPAGGAATVGDSGLSNARRTRRANLGDIPTVTAPSIPDIPRPEAGQQGGGSRTSTTASPPATTPAS